MPDWLQKWASRHPAKLILWIIGIVITVVTTLSKLGVLQSWFNGLLNVGTVFSKNGQIQAKSLFFIVALLIVLLAIISVTLALQQWVLRKAEAPTSAQEALNEMMVAAEIIRNRSFPNSRQAMYSLMSVKNVYYIRRNNDGEVHRYFEIRALDEPVQFYPIDISVSDKALPIQYLKSLQLRVRHESEGAADSEIVVLPTELTDRRKKLLLAFVPPIQPSEKTPRKVALTYEWKGMWEQLRLEKHETFEWPLDSRDPIPSIQFEILLDPLSSNKLGYQETGQRYPDARVDVIEREFENDKWYGYTYTIPNGPSGPHTYSILLKLREPTQ